MLELACHTLHSIANSEHVVSGSERWLQNDHQTPDDNFEPGSLLSEGISIVRFDYLL